MRQNHFVYANRARQRLEVPQLLLEKNVMLLLLRLKSQPPQS